MSEKRSTPSTSSRQRRRSGRSSSSRPNGFSATEPQQNARGRSDTTSRPNPAVSSGANQANLKDDRSNATSRQNAAHKSTASGRTNVAEGRPNAKSRSSTFYASGGTNLKNGRPNANVSETRNREATPAYYSLFGEPHHEIPPRTRVDNHVHPILENHQGDSEKTVHRAFSAWLFLNGSISLKDLFHYYLDLEKMEAMMTEAQRAAIHQREENILKRIPHITEYLNRFLEYFGSLPDLTGNRAMNEENATQPNSTVNHPFVLFAMASQGPSTPLSASSIPQPMPPQQPSTMPGLNVPTMPMTQTQTMPAWSIPAFMREQTQTSQPTSVGISNTGQSTSFTPASPFSVLQGNPTSILHRSPTSTTSFQPTLQGQLIPGQLSMMQGPPMLGTPPAPMPPMQANFMPSMPTPTSMTPRQPVQQISAQNTVTPPQSQPPQHVSNSLFLTEAEQACLMYFGVLPMKYQ